MKTEKQLTSELHGVMSKYYKLRQRLCDMILEYGIYGEQEWKTRGFQIADAYRRATTKLGWYSCWEMIYLNYGEKGRPYVLQEDVKKRFGECDYDKMCIHRSGLVLEILWDGKNVSFKKMGRIKISIYK